MSLKGVSVTKKAGASFYERFCTPQIAEKMTFLSVHNLMIITKRLEL